MLRPALFIVVALLALGLSGCLVEFPAPIDGDGGARPSEDALFGRVPNEDAGPRPVPTKDAGSPDDAEAAPDRARPPEPPTEPAAPPPPACPDADGDRVCDDRDVCPGGRDDIDGDADGTPDSCDPCPADAEDDVDGDGVCAHLDICALGDDRLDADRDGVPDACDPCPGDPLDDADQDGVCGDLDRCPGSDDRLDADADGVPDGCDPCGVGGAPAPSFPVVDGVVSIRSADINGQGWLAQVAGDTPVWVRVDYGTNACGAPDPSLRIELGFTEAPTRLYCVYPWTYECREQAYRGWDLRLLRSPAAPGIYPVRMAVRRDGSCSPADGPWPAGPPPPAATIGYLCVTP